MAPTTRSASKKTGGLQPQDPATAPSNTNTAPTTTPSNTNTAARGRKRKAQDDGGNFQELPLHPEMSVDKALAKGKSIVAGWTTIQRTQPFVNAYKSAFKEEPRSNPMRRVKRGPVRKARPGLIKAILHACYLDPKESPIDPEQIESDDVEGAQLALQVSTKLGNAQYKELTPSELSWYIKESRKSDPRLHGPTKERVAIRALLAMLLPASVSESSTTATISPVENIPHNAESTTAPSGLQRLPVEIHAMILSHLPSVRDVHNATKATAIFRNAFPHEAGSIVPRLVSDSFWGIAAIADDSDSMRPNRLVAALQGNEKQHQKIKREYEIQYGIVQLAAVAEYFPGQSSTEGKQRDFPRLQRTPRARTILTLAALVIAYVDAAISARLEAIVAFHVSVLETEKTRRAAAHRELWKLHRHNKWRQTLGDGPSSNYPWGEHVQDQPKRFIPFSDLHCIEEQFTHAVHGWLNLMGELRTGDVSIGFIDRAHQSWTDRQRADYDYLHGPPDGIPAPRLYEAAAHRTRFRRNDVYVHSGKRVRVEWADVGERSFTRHLLHPSLQLQTAAAHNSNDQSQSYPAHLSTACSTLREHYLTAIDNMHAWALINLSTRDRLILDVHVDRQEHEQAGPVRLEVKAVKVWDLMKPAPSRRQVPRHPLLVRYLDEMRREQGGMTETEDVEMEEEEQAPMPLRCLNRTAGHPS